MGEIYEEEEPKSMEDRGRKGNSLTLLDAYGTNVTKLASEKRLDPVIGREDEILRVIQILGRRRKNNPVLVGEPGVGKTAIAEGIAKKIVDGDVPEVLESAKIFSLDIGVILQVRSIEGILKKDSMRF